MTLMSSCNQHGIKFSYTCPICEVELSYITRLNLLEHFRAGVAQKPIGNRRGAEKEAFLHGLKTGNWHRARQPKPEDVYAHVDA